MRSKILVLGLVCLCFTSCATLFKGASEEVNINSDPQRAQVFINGSLRGETPLTLKLECKKNYTIEFRKEGYKPSVYNISNHIGAGWIILDVFTGLVGIIIDAATGAWYTLDQKNVNMVLQNQQP